VVENTRLKGVYLAVTPMQRYPKLGWHQPLNGAREGAPFNRDHMIRTTTKKFDEFAAGATGADVNRRILGLWQVAYSATA
jgi:hypothetical protein